MTTHDGSMLENDLFRLNVSNAVEEIENFRSNWSGIMDLTNVIGKNAIWPKRKTK